MSTLMITYIVLTLLGLASLIVLRRRRQQETSSSETVADHELAASQLEHSVRTLRSNLAVYHTQLLEFRSRTTASLENSRADVDEMRGELERLLKPTESLANSLEDAFEQIRQQTNRLLSYMEMRQDPLTGLGNQRAMEGTLANLFAMMTRYRSLFSVALLEVEPEGEGGAREILISATAKVLLNTLRETDVVIRYGEAEFLLIMPDTDLAGACRAVQRAADTLKRTTRTPCHVGVTMALEGDNSRSLVSRADAARFSARAADSSDIFQHDGRHIVPAAALIGSKLNSMDSPLSSLPPDADQPLSEEPRSMSHVG